MMLRVRYHDLSNIFNKGFHNPLSFMCLKRYKKTDKPGGYIVEPTTMTIQKFDPASYSLKGVPPIITKYSSSGFNIQGNKARGPIVVLPQGFYAWRVKSWTDITIESLQLFTVLTPAIEILIVGTGDRIEFISPLIRQHFRKLNISLEILDTRNALSTFNFMLEEKRIVGAALIPPTNLSPL